jgi:integrase
VLVRRAARKGVEGRTKTRKRRRVSLCTPALRALRAQLLARRPNAQGLVFPSPRSDSVWNSDNFRADVFAKAVKRAVANVEPARRADVKRLEFHDLRHTFASLMIAAGANPLQLAEALGHIDQAGRPDPTRLEAVRPSVPTFDPRGCGGAGSALTGHRVEVFRTGVNRLRPATTGYRPAGPV